MKHKLITCLVISVLLISAIIPAFAETSIERITFDDGSYAIIETTVSQTPFTLFAAAKTKSASRTYTYYAADNIKKWDFSVNGTFSYDGSTAKATSSSSSYNIYASGWSLVSRNASKSGATATATGTFKYASITKSTTIGLKCSADGTISAV